MNTARLAAAVLAAAVATLHADTETTSQTFNTTLNDEPNFLTFDKFDPQGGARVLTGITLRLDTVITAELTAQNFTLNPLPDTDWGVEAGAQLIFQAGETTDNEEDPQPPFFGLGFLGVNPLDVVGELPAGTPDPNPGPFGPAVLPGTLTYPFSGSINSVLPVTANNFNAFTGTGTFTGIYGSFQDIIVTLTPNFGDVGGILSQFDQSGRLAIDYEFDVVTPTCVCEFDGDATQVDVSDLLTFLADWFAESPAADLDGSTVVDVVDLLDFLTCWFPANTGTPC